MAAPEEIGPDAARRMALAAQGLARARPDAPGTRQFKDAARRLGVIQIDSVNVVSRTHYLPPFSRLGTYPREVLETEAWGKAPSLFEYWGHEASLMPVEIQPLLRWRITNALPTRFKGPDLSSTADQVAIEELQLVHEGLELERA